MQKFHDPQGYRGRYPWDGSLDLPDSSLAKLDVVVAAVHSHFDLPRQAQTDRVIRALENRHVSILAHPTARLIGEPEPYDIDMDRVISTAHKAGCYLEINAGPDRLDLNDLHAHAAKFAGVKLAVSTDAHSIDAFQCMRFGIDQTRRAWLTANDVLNTQPLAELQQAAEAVRVAERRLVPSTFERMLLCGHGGLRALSLQSLGDRDSPPNGRSDRRHEGAW